MSVLEMEHSPVGPSSGERWIFCPGSVAVTQHMPDTTSDYAAEGTFAHYITELARNEGKDAIEYLGVTSEDGKFECDREMVDAVQDFLDYCDQFDGEVFIEQRVNYDAWVVNGFGTSDHIAIDDSAARCVVMDFKYGKGIQVNAKGNTQAKLYALGVYQEWSDLYEVDTFTLCISQPRINHRDQWDISVDALVKWADEVVEPAGDRVYEAVDLYEEHDEDDGPFQDAQPDFFRAGAWCQWCAVKGGCPTRNRLMRESALIGMEDVTDFDDEDAPVVSNPNELDNEELGKTMAVIDQIKKWCNDIEALVLKRVQGKQLIISGEDEDGDPEYFKMVEGRSNRKWRSEEEAKDALKRARLKIDEYMPRKLITAPAAETLVGKKHKMFKPDDDGVTLIVKPQGKPVMVPGSDPRDEYTIAANEMEDIEDEDDDTSWLDD